MLIPQAIVQQSGTAAILREEQVSGTNGGTFTSGGWQTRVLNTKYDTAGIVTLAANQFTLQAGTYRISASAPAVDVDFHQLKLRNITDSTDTLTGGAVFASAGTTVNNHSLMVGKFTIVDTKTFELQHRCTTTRATDGLGGAGGFGVTEVYAQVELIKEN